MMLLVSLLVMCLLSFAIAEFLGRSKHIGRGWSFALSLTGFLVVGLVASFLSPSAKKLPTKGHIAHLIIGILLLIHGVFTNIMFLLQAEPVGISQSLMFITLGIYLIVLSRGKVQNNNPKIYFNFTALPKITHFANNDVTKKQEVNETLYFVRENNMTSEPKTYNELSLLRIKEDTPVWRHGLEKWVLAKELKELVGIIFHEPPVFEQPNETVESEEKVVPPPYTEPKLTPPPFNK